MHEREHESPGVGRLVGIVLVMLLVVLGINAFAGDYLEDNTTNLGYRYISHKWKVLEELDEPVDWLVLGDSSVAQGFDPRILETDESETAINLGTIGVYGLIDDWWMLEEYVERFGPPKKVIIVHVYDVWKRGFPRRLLGKIPRERAMTKKAAKYFGMSWRSRRDRWLARYVPLYSEKRSIRAGFELAWHEATKTEKEMKKLRRRDSRFPQDDPVFTESGFVEVCEAIPRSANRDYRQHRQSLTKNPTAKISRTNWHALRNMGYLAQRKGFDIYVVNGPIHRKLPRTAAFKEHWGQLRGQLEEKIDTLDWVHFEPGFFRASPKELTSVDHISCDAAPRYTRWLIKRVKRLERKKALGAEWE